MTIKKRHNKEVITIIIITGELKKSKTKLKTDQIDFEPLILSYENMNGFKKLEKLKIKIKNREKLNETERLDLIFIPFMENEKNIEYLIYEVINLTNKIDYISKDEKNNIKLSQYILLNKHVKNLKMKKEMKDMINMENSIFDDFFDDAIEEGIENGRIEGIEKGRIEGIEKGRIEGIEKGRIEGRRELIKELIINLINENYDIEEISKITKLPLEKIQELK